jgi:hypothetical protein
MHLGRMIYGKHIKSTMDLANSSRGSDYCYGWSTRRPGQPQYKLIFQHINCIFLPTTLVRLTNGLQYLNSAHVQIPLLNKIFFHNRKHCWPSCKCINYMSYEALKFHQGNFIDPS